MKYSIVVLLSIFSISYPFISNAQQLTSQEKIEVYNGCMPACIRNQKIKPENKFLLDVPFVLESFCTCHCARISMRMSKKMIEHAGRAAIEGNKHTSDTGMEAIIVKNQAICVNALTEN